jgi:hypothetical protein
MDLAVGAPVVGGLAPESPDFVDLAAEAPDVSSPPAKRPCRSVSRSRIVATSLSSSSQVEPHSGGGRSVLSRPQSGRGGGRISAAGSVGALCGFSAEELGPLKALLQRLLERL